ncbi:radical SAM protein [Candidatus Omnitrophota bacterium]
MTPLFSKKTKKEAIQAVSAKAESLLKKCGICPRRCGVDRTKGGKGYCRAAFRPTVYSHSPHHGEEPVLSGERGSGTVFFSHCNMKCSYCQNYNFSQLDNGEETTIEGLSAMMLRLQKIGCHNINLVSPTHYVPQIVMALEIALGEGLAIPLVYNSGGYESIETLKLLNGIIDIYLPDMRYADSAMAKKYSDAPQYARFNKAAVRQMHSQVGDLSVDEKGIALKGLIIRLLALPHDISGTKKSLKFISEHVSKKAYLSIMSQYYPAYKARNLKELSGGVSAEEYSEVVDEARKLRLYNGWTQEGPMGLDERFFGPNIKPQRPVGG